jgi:SAM-dependent methyltransferase
MNTFLNEVHRILKPGGYLLFADHRDYDKVAGLRSQLNQAGLEIETETDITPNVVRALELDHERKQKLIHDSCPKLLQRDAGEFAALVGTRTYESFRSKESGYFSFRITK